MSALDDFHALVAGVNYPMFIVTAAAEGRRAGCLIGFATQASIAPPRLLVLISKANHTYRVARDATTLAVHFLREDNYELATLFGEQTGDEVDKFATLRWQEGPGHAPILEGTRGWVAGPVIDRFDAGDHVAHLIGVQEAAAAIPGPQLAFQAVRDMEPGHPA